MKKSTAQCNNIASDLACFAQSGLHLPSTIYDYVIHVIARKYINRQRVSAPKECPPFPLPLPRRQTLLVVNRRALRTPNTHYYPNVKLTLCVKNREKVAPEGADFLVTSKTRLDFATDTLPIHNAGKDARQKTSRVPRLFATFGHRHCCHAYLPNSR